MSEKIVDKVRINFNCEGCGQKTTNTIEITEEDLIRTEKKSDSPEEQMYYLCGSEPLFSDPQLLALIASLLGSTSVVVAEAILGYSVKELLDRVRDDGSTCGNCEATNETHIHTDGDVTVININDDDE